MPAIQVASHTPSRSSSAPFPLLDSDLPPRRREIVIETAFRGPGARDPFGMVPRAVTDERYVVDRELERPERGTTLERYVFRLRYRDRTVTVMIGDGDVTGEFIALARKDGRSAKRNNISLRSSRKWLTA